MKAMHIKTSIDNNEKVCRLTHCQPVKHFQKYSSPRIKLLIHAVIKTNKGF